MSLHFGSESISWTTYFCTVLLVSAYIYDISSRSSCAKGGLISLNFYGIPYSIFSERTSPFDSTTSWSLFRLFLAIIDDLALYRS